MIDLCDALCYMEHNCASYNLIRRSEGHRCELNNSTHEGNENDMEENPNYIYRGTKARKLEKIFNCSSNYMTEKITPL